jgi:hypothetical protein
MRFVSRHRSPQQLWHQFRGEPTYERPLSTTNLISPQRQSHSPQSLCLCLLLIYSESFSIDTLQVARWLFSSWLSLNIVDGASPLIYTAADQHTDATKSSLSHNVSNSITEEPRTIRMDDDSPPDPSRPSTPVIGIFASRMSEFQDALDQDSLRAQGARTWFK